MNITKSAMPAIYAGQADCVAVTGAVMFRHNLRLEVSWSKLNQRGEGRQV